MCLCGDNLHKVGSNTLVRFIWNLTRSFWKLSQSGDTEKWEEVFNFWQNTPQANVIAWVTLIGEVFTQHRFFTPSSTCRKMEIIWINFLRFFGTIIIFLVHLIKFEKFTMIKGKNGVRWKQKILLFFYKYYFISYKVYLVG